MFENIAFLLSSMSPFTMSASVSSATCRMNGEIVPCPEFWGFFTTAFLLIPVLIFVFVAIMIVSTWFVYQKAGKPGWASLIPIYNMVKMLEIIGKQSWWVLLMFIPLVNIIIGFIVMFGLAKAFGKGFGFGLGLALLPFIFLPILAFGKSQCVGINNSENTTPPLTNTPEANL